MIKATLNNPDMTCTLHRRDGTEVILSRREVMAIVTAYDKECRCEDLFSRLENFKDEDGTYSIGSYHSVNLTESQAENLVKRALCGYTDSYNSSDDWDCLAYDALVNTYGEIHREMLRDAAKVCSRKICERNRIRHNLYPRR